MSQTYLQTRLTAQPNTGTAGFQQLLPPDEPLPPGWPSVGRKYIAVDLDGTLAMETKTGKIGDPIQPMVDRIHSWIRDGFEVRIFTARATDPDQRLEIQQWLKRHGLPDLAVTAIKDAYMLEIWDNRAVRVQSNTGKPCAGCVPDGKLSTGHHDHSTHLPAQHYRPGGEACTDC